MFAIGSNPLCLRTMRRVGDTLSNEILSVKRGVFLLNERVKTARKAAF